MMYNRMNNYFTKVYINNPHPYDRNRKFIEFANS